MFVAKKSDYTCNFYRVVVVRRFQNLASPAKAKLDDNLIVFCQVRYKLGLSDDEEDEEDSGEVPRSDQDLCHPLCQCDKCSKWQKVSHVNKG